MDVERTLQELVDRQQITEVLYRYASAIDGKDIPTLRSLFVDDAVGQLGDAEPIHGADELVHSIEWRSVGGRNATRPKTEEISGEDQARRRPGQPARQGLDIHRLVQ